MFLYKVYYKIHFNFMLRVYVSAYLITSLCCYSREGATEVSCYLISFPLHIYKTSILHCLLQLKCLIYKSWLY